MAAYLYGLGRRKSATARARLIKGGKGTVMINGLTSEQYFDDSQELFSRILQPLIALEKSSDYNITLLVRGGGKSGQADACKLAIANALASIDETHRSTLKKFGHLKRDSREKERQKPGLRRARKQEQFSKR